MESGRLVVGGCVLVTWGQKSIDELIFVAQFAKLVSRWLRSRARLPWPGFLLTNAICSGLTGIHKEYLTASLLSEMPGKSFARVEQLSVKG